MYIHIYISIFFNSKDNNYKSYLLELSFFLFLFSFLKKNTKGDGFFGHLRVLLVFRFVINEQVYMYVYIYIYVRYMVDDLFIYLFFSYPRIISRSGTHSLTWCFGVIIEMQTWEITV